MRVIGFNFTKINVEKMKDSWDKVEIKTNIDVPTIKSIGSDILKTKEEIIEAKFVYGVQYEPEIAKVELEGRILLTMEPKQAKEILKQWKKKKTPEEFRIFLFNMVLRKSTLKALYLEDEMNLPLHMPMPTFRGKKEE